MEGHELVRFTVNVLSVFRQFASRRSNFWSYPRHEPVWFNATATRFLLPVNYCNGLKSPMSLVPRVTVRHNPGNSKQRNTPMIDFEQEFYAN